MKKRLPKSAKNQKENSLRGNKKVLIVDDEMDIRRNCKQFFEKFSINVDAAGSAAEALKFCDRNIYALVFLDVGPPDMNGFEFLEMLKKKYVSTKVVMITGDASPEKELEAFEKGASGFLTKPFDLQELKAIISKLL